MSQKNRTELRKKDFLVVRQTKNQNIAKVITPQTFQVGLNDDEFKKSLIVKGGAQISGAASAGSLEVTGNTTLKGRLLNNSGTPFIAGSGNVTVTENASGGVTISATLGTGATLSQATNGGIQPFSYDGSSPATVEVDLFSATGLELTSLGLAIDPSQANELSATPAVDDYLLIHDTSDTAASRNVKKISVSNLMNAASSLSTLGNPQRS